MQDFSELIKRIDGILRYPAVLDQNEDHLKVGESKLEFGIYRFGLSKSMCLNYPQEIVPERMAELICLLLESYQPNPHGDSTSSLFRKILEIDSSKISAAYLSKLGIPEGTGCWTLLLKLGKKQEGWQALIFSYFHEKVIFTMIDEMICLLVPQERLPLEEGTKEEMEEWTLGLTTLFMEEGYDQVMISVSEPVFSAKDWATSFLKARKALEAGSSFYPEKKVYFSWQLPLELLLHQLPLDTAMEFVAGIFGKKNEKFDQETFLTLEVLLQENLNISEAARKLFIHRNTLLYRIERWKEEVGRDPRSAKDAALLYLAMLLSKRNYS